MLGASSSLDNTLLIWMTKWPMDQRKRGSFPSSMIAPPANLPRSAERIHFLLSAKYPLRSILNMLHKLRIQVGEAIKLGLVQVHHKQFIRGREVRLLRGELPVKVGHVLAVFLQ